MLKCLEYETFCGCFWRTVVCCVTESAPTSPSNRVDAARQHSTGANEPATSRLTADYPILPVLSSSAPEREGIWHEVKRKSTERMKVTTPKDVTLKQRVEVRFESVFCCLVVWDLFTDLFCVLQLLTLISILHHSWGQLTGIKIAFLCLQFHCLE